MDQVKVSIDLALLTLEVDGPADFATSVVDTFLNAVRNREESSPRATLQVSESASSAAAPVTSNGSTSPTKKPSKRAKSFELLPELLTPENGRKLKDFFEDKKPKSQNDQTLVLMRGLQNALGKRTFSYNELFTAFRSVGATVPKSLPGVIANLRMQTLLTGTGDELTLHYTGEDHVDKNLPASKKPNKD